MPGILPGGRGPPALPRPTWTDAYHLPPVSPPVPPPPQHPPHPIHPAHRCSYPLPRPTPPRPLRCHCATRPPASTPPYRPYHSRRAFPHRGALPALLTPMLNVPRRTTTTCPALPAGAPTLTPWRLGVVRWLTLGGNGRWFANTGLVGGPVVTVLVQAGLNYDSVRVQCHYHLPPPPTTVQTLHLSTGHLVNGGWWITVLRLVDAVGLPQVTTW